MRYQRKHKCSGSQGWRQRYPPTWMNCRVRCPMPRPVMTSRQWISQTSVWHIERTRFELLRDYPSLQEVMVVQLLPRFTDLQIQTYGPQPHYFSPHFNEVADNVNYALKDQPWFIDLGMSCLPFGNDSFMCPGLMGRGHCRKTVSTLMQEGTRSF